MDLDKLIEQYADLYPFSKEQTILKQRSQEAQAIAQARVESEQRVATAENEPSVLPTPHELPDIPLETPSPEVNVPIVPTSAPEPPPIFKPSMMNMLDTNRLQDMKRAHQQRNSSQMRIVRGILIVIVIGSLGMYLYNRSKSPQ